MSSTAHEDRVSAKALLLVFLDDLCACLGTSTNCFVDFERVILLSLAVKEQLDSRTFEGTHKVVDLGGRGACILAHQASIPSSQARSVLIELCELVDSCLLRDHLRFRLLILCHFHLSFRLDIIRHFDVAIGICDILESLRQIRLFESLLF